MSTSKQLLQDSQKVHRADFLFKAGHGMLFAVPSLSRYYMNEYQSTLNEYELTPHRKLNRVCCKSCGQIRLPGLNTRVELKKHKKSNRLNTTCLTCSRTMQYGGSNKKLIPKKSITSHVPVIDDIPSPVVDSTKKKNNKKKNSLKALINKSNSNSNSNKSGGGGLSDFLSSL